MQTNWIGRSEGAELQFKVDESDKTLYGILQQDPILSTAFRIWLLHPEHPIVDELISGKPQEAECREFIKKRFSHKAKLCVLPPTRKKRVFFTGTYVINPFSGEKYRCILQITSLLITEPA